LESGRGNQGKNRNVDEDTYKQLYKQFSELCKSRGMSMSKKIQMFMESVISGEPEANQEYLEKLNDIRKGKFVHVRDVSSRYGDI
jgi:antitoxin component of RelBE/YafQ-DinJ toxin-antitoxin module